MVSIIYAFPSVLISTTNSIIHPPFVQSKISRDTTLHPLENSDKIYYYNYHRNWWQHSYYRVSHPLQENSISPLSRKNPNDTILYNFNRPSILDTFLAITQVATRAGKKEKAGREIWRVFKRLGKGRFTGRYYDSYSRFSSIFQWLPCVSYSAT